SAARRRGSGRACARDSGARALPCNGGSRASRPEPVSDWTGRNVAPPRDENQGIAILVSPQSSPPAFEIRKRWIFRSAHTRVDRKIQPPRASAEDNRSNRGLLPSALRAVAVGRDRPEYGPITTD